MKKFNLIILILAAFAVTSCKKDKKQENTSTTQEQYESLSTITWNSMKVEVESVLVFDKATNTFTDTRSNVVTNVRLGNFSGEYGIVGDKIFISTRNTDFPDLISWPDYTLSKDGKTITSSDGFVYKKPLF